MRTTTNLHELITSLTQTEKAYIKKKSFHSKSNNYLKLFDIIAQQDNYDEEKIIDKFKGQDLLKNFSRTKNYLYNYILDRLIEYHKENFDSIKIKYLLNQANLLYRKGLFQHSKTLFLKALRLSDNSSDTISKLETLNGLLNIYNNALSPETFPFENELLTTASQIKRENNVRHHDHQINRELNKTKTISPQLKEEMEKLLALGVFDKKTNDPVSTQWACLTSKYNIYQYQNEIGKTEETIKEMQFLVLNEGWDERKVERYFDYLNKEAEFLSKNKRFKEAKATVEKILKVKSKPTFFKRDEILKYKYYYFHTLKNLLLQNKLKEIQLLLPEIENWFEQHEEELTNDLKYFIPDLLFISRFSIEDYHKALKGLNKVILNEYLTGNSLKINALIQAIVCHLELGHYDIIEYANSNLRNELVKSKEKNVLESFFAEQLAQTNLVVFEKEELRIRLLQNLKRDIDALIIAKGISFKNNVSFLLSWLESKTQKSNFLNEWHKNINELINNSNP